MAAPVLSLLLSDENSLAIAFGAAYLFVGSIYVLIVWQLLSLYLGTRDAGRKKIGLCLLAAASSFCTFSIGIGVGLPGWVAMLLWVGLPLLVIILALIKPSEWFRWPQSPSRIVNLLQLLLRLVLFGAVLLLLAIYYSLPDAPAPLPAEGNKVAR